MKKHPLRLLRDAFLIGAFSFLLYAVGDLAYGLLFPPRPYDSYKERLTSPAYIKEPYYSEEFLIESFIQPGEWLTEEGTRLVFPKEFHGNYFNVDVLKPTGLPYRRTINKVGDAQSVRTVLVLGGSTIYNSEVPDEYTVASQLSRILNEDGNGSFYCLNAGVTSANTTQELERLEKELQMGLRPDIVISYSGINDSLQGVYFGNPDGVMFSHETKPAVLQPEPNRFKSFVKEFMPAWAYEAGKHVKSFLVPNRIYQALALRTRYYKLRETPLHMRDERAIHNLAEKTAILFEKNIARMHTLSNKYGFNFLVFLQPHMYSGTDYRESHDVELARQFDAIRYPKIEIAFAAAYHDLAKSVDRLRARGINAHNMSTLFNGKNENIFLDSHHVNSSGNTGIARAIHETIRTDLPVGRQ
jgi:lysophospholipase L1-like esterase